jgi:copper chaperone NosL
MLAAALVIGGALLLPLWEVRLVAPQYPEGLGMRIHLNTVVGIKPNDLNSINGLNHYIGMKPIVPDAIPELRWMPWVVVGLMIGGLLVAWRASRRGVMAWLTAFVLLGGIGLWDFHRWEYDYGHELDAENAIIVVPGMNYEPPLIGSKQLLNFTATSWPASGTVALGLGFVLAVGALVTSGRGRRARRAAHPAFHLPVAAHL